jgi:pimeloyl-ACP methyl ester carboxylesterase
MRRAGVEKAVVVGHSVGGEIALRIATRCPARVAALVFVSAVIPPSGKSMTSFDPLRMRLMMRLFSQLGPAKPPEAIIKAAACNALSPEDCERVVGSYRPESWRLFFDPVRWEIDASVPRHYVKTLRDRSLPVKLQERMIKNISPVQLHEIDSGHLPMLSSPKELADMLHAIGRISLP